MNEQNHETIKRYVFEPCRLGQCDKCPCWKEGYVDGVRRAAGEQCSHECHGAISSEFEEESR